MTPTDPGAPRRLRDEEPDDALGQLLGAARADLPDDDALARLAARLGPLLPPSDGGGPDDDGGPEADGAPPDSAPSAPTVPTAAPASTGLFGLSPIAVRLGIIAMFGSIWAGARLSQTSDEPPVPKGSPQVVVRQPLAPEVVPAEVPAVPPPVPVPDPAPRPKPVEREPPTPPTLAPPLPGEPTPATQDTLTAELELVGTAQLTLEEDPAEALSLAEDHARRFPVGQLTQEREVVAIQALAALGRTTEAQSRARRFKETWPASAYNRRLEVVVGAPAP